MESKNEMKWIVMREGIVTNVFDNRMEAIKHFKEVILQTLRDIQKQEDSPNKYDFEIFIPSIKILHVKQRDAFLGL